MKNQWAELQIGLPTGQGVATYPAGAMKTVNKPSRHPQVR